MQAFSYFSKHAVQRVQQRTTMSTQDIALVLDNHLCVNIGRKPGFNRNHLLFYSAADDDFYVAIQDGLCGKVVTILPLNYHAELAWPVREQDRSEAKERMTAFAKVRAEKLRSPTLKPTVLLVNGIYKDDNGKNKSRRLIKIAAKAHHTHASSFVDDPDLVNKARNMAREQGLTDTRLLGFSVRLGHGGVPYFIAHA